GRACRQAEAAVDAVLRQLADHRPSISPALPERTTPSDSLLLGVRPGAAALLPCNRLSLGQFRDGRARVSVHFTGVRRAEDRSGVELDADALVQRADSLGHVTRSLF